jgi:serine/threonine protein kinase
MKITDSTLQTLLGPYRIGVSSLLSTRPFTACFLGVQLESKAAVFIKVLHSEEPKVKRNFLRELEILEMMSGQAGFPVLIAACSNSRTPFSVCGYLSMTTLASAFTCLEHSTVQDAFALIRPLAKWIVNLHSRGYAHRDLSPEHIFTTDRELPIVVDFGMARCTREVSQQQALLYEGYDVQTFGMIFWELICGRSVFAYRAEALNEQILRELQLIHSVRIPDGVKNLIVGCLATASEFTPNGTDSSAFILSAEELHNSMREVEITGDLE